jgi:glutamate synthase (NADPH/NADH) large chain
MSDTKSAESMTGGLWVPQNQLAGTLYQPLFEKDSCGFGFIAHLENRPSHHVVQTALTSLTRLSHRGAVAQDGKTGDGCGVLLKKPDAFLRAVAAELGFDLSPLYAVAQLFLNPNPELAEEALAELRTHLESDGMRWVGVRQVPTHPAVCGEHALKSLPQMLQVFVNAPQGWDATQFERRLFVARRRAEKALLNHNPGFYVASFSCHTLIYKGMVTPENLATFYPDLQDKRMASSLCLYHQRFSTNTWPEWYLAQPFRMLAHNGEINTIQGNRNWAKSRGHLFSSPLIPELQDLLPLADRDGSDSMTLDNVLEGLVAGGMDIRQAIRLLIPPVWQNRDAMDPDLRAFYEYYSLHMDPWDGPAGLILTDGRLALCTMDRNGLRPARYVITDDGHLTIASEIGVYDYAPESVVSKGRLGPGDILCLDMHTGKIAHTAEVDAFLKGRHFYLQWLNQYTHYLKTDIELEGTGADTIAPEKLTVYEKQFELTLEEKDQVLKVLGETAQEPVASMGDDTALPVLSTGIRPLYEYFRQEFAQITNPPIDSLRELTVMSLRSCFGREYNPFIEVAEHAQRIDIYSPVLSRSMFMQLMAFNQDAFRHHVIDLTYPAEDTLRGALDRICDDAVEAVRAGAVILVLSDRSIAPHRLPVHALLATGAVHHRLSHEGLRCDANLVVETATARDPHHFAVLIGNGATAIYPYLAYQSLYHLMQQKSLSDKAPSRLMGQYRQAIHKGLFKILSKMGISTINSYRGAQLFEIVGLHDEVVHRCFPGTVSRIQGANFDDLELDTRQLATDAWRPHVHQRAGGILKCLPKGEYHAFNPEVVQSLQTAVKSGDYADYQVYAGYVNSRPPASLRDLLALQPAAEPLSLEQVEPIEAILPRFDSAAMSLGSLSPEAHESLAVAMNRIGGRSNSGEGGEDPARYGTERVSKIKQIASGRFGVTPSYLVNAEVLQIKIAQGAKPGEGGQLPGHKVTDLIAKLRYTLPGTPLISPPPHHDIYSIEDLAELIFDLKQVNPQALVSVKLVSEPGVGTVAAGVAKTYADLITISGHDGGTGASPVSSVRYAGSPWELGLSEAYQVLRANDLRGRVRLQADGGMKSGLDVVKAAILGAESFGFGTAPLVALGCKYLRICHLNNCATGVATQNTILRAHHFVGTADRVEAYFKFVAQEVREWLALLGAQSLNEIIGRTELLTQIEGLTNKQRRVDLSPLLHVPDELSSKPQYCHVQRNDPNDKGVLAEQMWTDTQHAIEHKNGGIFAYAINNTHRAIGARLSGEIARRHGDNGMKNAPLHIHLTGTAGQSFGAFNAGGLNLILEGDANDYVGKGMAGGKIVVYPPKGSQFKSHETPIMGNTCLYGATGGRLFAAGTAGVRFAVRNSGATAVVEGVSDHACEYMTGGVVVVLGQTGFNFGAGMTGGCAYVLDLDDGFVDLYNHDLVDIHRIHTENREEYAMHLESLLKAFVHETNSAWGTHVLNQYTRMLDKFWLVKPKATEMESLLRLIEVAA